MRLALMLFTLIAGVVSAEQVGNIQFDLPKDWHVAGKIDNEWGITQIYEKENGNGNESIGINVNNADVGDDDLASIKKGLEAMGDKVDIKEIEKTPNGIIYEWKSKSSFGLGRAFKWKGGSALLNYLSKENNLAEAKKLWLPILRQAKMDNTK